MKYRGRLSGADEFGELVVKSLPGGNVLRLKEVADVELGDEYYNYSSQVNGHPAAMMMINQKAGSNASSTSTRFTKCSTNWTVTRPKERNS